MVNFTCQYNPKDFLDQNNVNSTDLNFNKQIETFFDHVIENVESSLQSNELINVFQDDFECLGEKNEEKDSKSASLSNDPLPYFEGEFLKNR
jgi:hypothetical protein